jgi:hypothetical protein
MPICFPSERVVDERAVRSFRRVTSQEAEQQGFSDCTFQVFGDLTISDVVEYMKAGDYQGEYHFRNWVRIDPGLTFTQYSDFSESEEPLYHQGRIVYVDEQNIDNVVIATWTDYFKEISQDRVDRKSHDTALDCCSRDKKISTEFHPYLKMYLGYKAIWEESGYHDENAKKDMQALESILENCGFHKVYQEIKDELKPKMLQETCAKVVNSYKVPDTDLSFGDTFQEIEAGGDSSVKLYQRLVKLHNGLSFRKVA